MKVLITGASGFIGRALSDELLGCGHEPIALERSRQTDGHRTWEPASGRIDSDALAEVDAVVHLAGETIGGRWTESKKRRIVASRTEGTDLISRAVAEAKPSVFFCGSAIGFYGSRGDEILTEQSEGGVGFLANLTELWEQSAGPAIEAGVRTVLGRTSLVLDGSGGSFPRMLLPFKLGVGGPLGSGKQWMAWIALRDQVRAIVHCLESTALEGPVNLSAPDPKRNADFAKVTGRTLHRPAVMPAPAFALKALLGREFADEVVLASQRVVPTKLESVGFSFLYPDLSGALASMM